MSERNEISYGQGFLRDVRGLPRKIQSKLADLVEILQTNAFDSQLHAKALSAPLAGKFSFRITRDWRVGFKFIGPHVIQLLAVDRRDKIYKRLERA